MDTRHHPYGMSLQTPWRSEKTQQPEHQVGLALFGLKKKTASLAGIGGIDAPDQ